MPPSSAGSGTGLLPWELPGAVDVCQVKSVVFRQDSGRRQVIQLGLAALTACVRWPRPAAAGPVGRSVISLQPLGAALPGADVALVVAAMETFMGRKVRVMAPVALPASAFYAPRGRYRAEKLLAFLRGRLADDALRIQGLTVADISTTNGRFPDWGILGLGDLPGPASVISSFRCKKTARSPAHARERLAKVAVHELGHTLGLAHCSSRGCLMEDAGGLVATCDREYDFCRGCRALLVSGGHALPAAPKIPWPRPVG
jgi:archaemetzincin